MDVEAETAEQAKDLAITKFASLEGKALEDCFANGGDLEALSVMDDQFETVWPVDNE